MKTTRTATVEMPELVKFLKEKLGITAHPASISIEVVKGQGMCEQDAIRLTWTEGNTNLDSWNDR
jgi:hypothetical protein